MLSGGFLYVVDAMACIGTAVTLYPVLKRQNEATALGFVTARVLEAPSFWIGVSEPAGSFVTLRQGTWAGAIRCER